MNMQPDLYELNVYTAAFSITVLGGAELKSAYNAWRDGAFVASNRFTVEGFQDDAAKSPLLVSMESESIMGVTLTRR